MRIPSLRHLALCLIATAGLLPAQVVPGGNAIVAAPTSLLVNDKPVSTVDAGQSVIILGIRKDKQQAVISFTTPAGARAVGAVPLDSLVAVDAESAIPAPSAAVPASAPAAPAVIPAPVATTPPNLDLSKTLSALEIARFFKTDRARAKATCEGQRLKFTGVIDRLGVASVDGGAGDYAILTLGTAPGLPRLKVAISTSIGADTYFQRYNGYLPGWWWGYNGRQIDLRVDGSTQIQGRAVYRNAASHYGSSSPWFVLFRVGDPVTIDATCRGLYLDVEFEGGTMLPNQ